MENTNNNQKLCFGRPVNSSTTSQNKAKQCFIRKGLIRNRSHTPTADLIVMHNRSYDSIRNPSWLENRRIGSSLTLSCWDESICTQLVDAVTSVSGIRASLFLFIPLSVMVLPAASTEIAKTIDIIRELYDDITVAIEYTEDEPTFKKLCLPLLQTHIKLILDLSHHQLPFHDIDLNVHGKNIVISPKSLGIPSSPEDFDCSTYFNKVTDLINLKHKSGCDVFVRNVRRGWQESFMDAIPITGYDRVL